MKLNDFIDRAKHSALHLWVLNIMLYRMIPFNKPHRLKIETLADDGVKALLPYRRRNFNHIRGLHACVLATLTEFTSGFVLLSKLGFEKYRIILQRLEMDYLYQGKMDAVAEFKISDSWLQTMVYTPLASQEAVVVVCEVKVYDIKGNHLTTGHVHWQIKNWAKVKTHLRSN
jgi:acyl-coenzyme A thioesterase PaaI-like protein